MLSLRQLCGATTLLLSGQVALADLGIQADNVGMSSKKPHRLTSLETYICNTCYDGQIHSSRRPRPSLLP